MEIVVTIAIIVVALPYIAGPLLLWMGGSRLPPTMLEYVTPETSLPPVAESHFWKATYFFSANGFQQLGDRVRESASNGLSAHKQVWRNAETGELALVGAFLNAKDSAFCNTFVAFLHDRGNGARVMTSSFDAGARTLLDPPGTSKISVPYQEIDQLRALHQAHVAAHGAGSVRPMRVRDSLELCRELDSASRRRAIQTKRFRAEGKGKGEGDTLRITLWGALFGIWINLPPLKWKFEREERRFLEQVLAARSGVRTLSRAA